MNTGDEIIDGMLAVNDPLDHFVFWLNTRPSLLSPERNLCAEILRQAVQDLKNPRTYAPSSGKPGPGRKRAMYRHRGRVRQSVRDWFISTGHDAFEFEWVCEALNLAPGIIRSKLELWRMAA